MITHLLLESLCTLIGLFLFIQSRKEDALNIIFFGLFGLFLAITGLIHVFFSFHVSDKISISCLFPALVTPIWFLYVSKPKRQFKIWALVVSSLSIIGLIIALNYWQNYYWSSHIIGRPIEIIPAILACLVAKKVYNNNGKGRVKTLALLFFGLSHLFMIFSTKLFDEAFIISHTLKLSWHIVLLLLMYNLYNPQYSEKELLNSLNKGNNDNI